MFSIRPLELEAFPLTPDVCFSVRFLGLSLWVWCDSLKFPSLRGCLGRVVLSARGKKRTGQEAGPAWGGAGLSRLLQLASAPGDWITCVLGKDWRVYPSTHNVESIHSRFYEWFQSV